MNAIIKDFPRIDRGQTAQVMDLSALGSPRRDGAGRVQLGSLGTELASDAQARAKIARVFGSRWSMDAQDKKVQDAAANFVTNGLRQVMGPQEDVVRGSDSRFIFVPRPNRPLALPSRNLLDPGARSNAYRIRERQGSAQWVTPSAGLRDLPRSSYSTEEKDNGAEWYAAAWGYSLPDEWQANLLNEDLLGELQMAATEALDIMREQVSGWGDIGKKLPGMFRLGDALLVFGGTRFSAGSVAAIDMLRKLAHVDLVYQNANDEMQATRLIAPISDKVAMQTTYFGDASVGDSVWARATEMFPWLQNAIWTRRLATANAAGNAPRWVLYTDDPSKLYIEHTETMLFGPFPDMMDQVFIMLRRHGGVVNKIPERVMYVDFTA